MNPSAPAPRSQERPIEDHRPDPAGGDPGSDSVRLMISRVAQQKPSRRRDLDRAKGLGILLVVIGHLVSRIPPQGNDWYIVLKHALYHFHMPFFMYLSGYVVFLTGSARIEPSKWLEFTSRRMYRLLLPFVLFGVAILLGKLLASRFIQVDNLPGSLDQGLWGLVWYTDASPAESVWYLAVLFALSILTPPILWLLRGRTALLLALALILYVLPVPHVMYLDRIARFMSFFAMGGLASDAGKTWLDLIDRYFVWALVALLGALWLALTVFATWNPDVALFVCGTLSMPALHGLVRHRYFAASSLLLTLGIYTMVIYLLNTPFIGLVKGAMLKVLPWDGANFLLYAPVLTIAGTLLPILLKRYVLSKVPALDRMTA
jgi:fucose 4-O-acetylase-like acetyltransferase